MAPLVRTGGSRHTGLAALPHRNIQYLDWSVKLGYRFAWGCDTVIVVHLLIKKFKFVLFEAIGNISYEIFWVHGYFIETGMMSAYNMIIPCIVITILSAIVLCIFDKKIQNSKLVKNILL